MKRFFIFSLSFLCLVCFSLQARAAAPSLERLLYYTDTDNGYTSLKAHAKQIDILVPQAYVFNATGTIAGAISSRTLSLAAANHIPVMPLLESAHSDINANDAFLHDTSAQDILLSSIIALSQAYNFYGWQLDMEHINASDRSLFTAFAQKMAVALHLHGLQFSIAVSGKTSDNPADYDATSWNEWDGVFDYAALAQSADFLSVMAYDEPDSAGPPASLPWFEKVVAYATSTVPASKLSIGIPFYAWEWISGETPAIASHTYAYVKEQVPHLTRPIVFDSSLGSDVMHYTVLINHVKKNRILWYENITSFTLKYDFLKKTGVRGFSAWALGQEDPRDWTLLPARKISIDATAPSSL